MGNWKGHRAGEEPGPLARVLSDGPGSVPEKLFVNLTIVPVPAQDKGAMAILWPLTVALKESWPGVARSDCSRETGRGRGVAPSYLPSVPDIVTVATLLTLAATHGPKSNSCFQFAGLLFFVVFFWSHALGTSFIGCIQS